MKKLSVLLLTIIACCMLWACGKTATFNESEEETTTHNLSLVTLVSLPTFTEGITFAFKSLLTVAGVTPRISATVETLRTAGYFANSSFISSSFL